MKGREIVLEGDDRAPQSPLESPDLRGALDDAVKRDAYLTAEEAALYVRSASVKAFYDWRLRHGVAACRSGVRGKLLFRRRDLDEALAPAPDRRHRRHFASVSTMRRTS